MNDLRLLYYKVKDFTLCEITAYCRLSPLNLIVTVEYRMVYEINICVTLQDSLHLLMLFWEGKLTGWRSLVV
jgi:hypothetical protein